ncbi:V4R domain-containing protein [Dictyobacter arantiisoli]|uniref:Uncharacterized protein n=1 Tax=Dictyobacter arantiisoli TaxID=2014874 RepID=A0A5A5TBI8_9CHLR|nr:V4R domain-containing protein [Dictyobacter arantiisoli]GCF08369.1 hypothetical protein KDI_19330 [Dictyobacter arantiisoli]
MTSISIPRDMLSNVPHDPIALARKHIILIIDVDEMRAQNLACLLTLAGLRAIVTTTTYQAFQRFLQESFMPGLILLGKQEEMTTPLFARFFQRLTQEFQRDTPILTLSKIQLQDGNLLLADKSASSTKHRVSQTHSEILKMIWRVLPSAQIPLQVAEHSLATDKLPEMGLFPRVAKTKRSASSHFRFQLKAAKQVIPTEQWELLLTDVGLAQYCKERNWPSSADEYIIPPEYTTCLNRAVMFSQPAEPIQQVYKWAKLVDAAILQKPAFIFMLQQIPKVLGQDRTMREVLKTFTNELHEERREDLADWKRLEDESFLFVFYSNLFIYGFMGANQPSCYVWLATFERILEITKMQKRWQIRELECSGQTYTGHCVFQLTPVRS